MSFTNIYATEGKPYAPGWFLAHEECTRVTTTASAENAAVETAENGGKYLPMGTIYPANDSTAKGIIYEDVDVTTGDMPASLVTAGTVVTDRLPVAPETAAKTALEKLGIKFVTETAVTRPY